tara:strand:+ start:1023 stop:1724 length:702 start_codon:yes stop_codon:yes gene_type:complete
MENHFKKILIIAAHPDDEILGCGGLINKFSKQNADIRVVFMAEGISSRYNLKNSELTKKIKNEICYREKCALSALELLGISKTNIFFSKRKCCQLDTYPLLEITKEIEFHIKDFTPSCLITHFAKDTNIDHRICFQATLPAIRPTKENSLKLVLSFEVISSTEWNYPEQFRPNFFINIEDEIENKLNACLRYDNEISKDNDRRSIDVIRSLAKLRGSQSGYSFSEGFQLIVRR